jgi:membrane-associated HD superfamily phosphohydrolase
MCFSFEVSITTFIISWTISLYLLKKKLNETQRQNIIFLLIFSSIQFADSILWLINLKKNNINFLVTSFLIPFILSLQVFYNMFVINKIRNPIISILIFIYIFGIFAHMYGYSIKSKNIFDSPIWGSKEATFINMLIFFGLIVYGRIGFKGEKLHFSLIIIFALLLPFLFRGGYGSLWCAFANILAFYYLYNYGFKLK